MTSLPCPRFELRWEPVDESEQADGFDWKCTYSLVIPLRDGDIRRDEDDSPEMQLEIGVTRTSRNGNPPVTNGEVETPFRDGCHVQWDCEALGGHLPIVAVCGDESTLIPREANLRS